MGRDAAGAVEHDQADVRVGAVVRLTVPDCINRRRQADCDQHSDRYRREESGAHDVPFRLCRQAMTGTTTAAASNPAEFWMT